jgi:hypothetical protein
MFVLKDHTGLLREERFTNAIPMEEAQEVNLEENAISFSFTNGAHIEKA